MAVILRRAAEHGRAADVDVLDRFLEGHVGLGDGLFKGVEIHHHEVDGEDAVRLRLGDVLRVFAQEEQAAVHLRVQRFDPAIHHLGKAGELGDLAGGDAFLVEQRGGAAGGDDLDAGATRPRANSTRPVLSETEIRAR